MPSKRMNMQADFLEALRPGGRGARILLVAAHPDDEVIGAGSRIPTLAELTIVHVTDGAPRNLYDAARYGFRSREDYAAARRAEFHCAMAAAGAAPDCVEVGIADQDAAASIPLIVEALNRAIDAVKPDILLTHPYEGGHPDHDACALAVHLAGGSLPVVEFASYHNANGRIRTGEFLPGPGEILTIELTETERAAKRRMLDCFHTQQETLAPFGVERERFRMAPEYDFTAPPHEGPLYYEQFPWGMTGERFRSIAREVLARC